MNNRVSGKHIAMISIVIYLAISIVVAEEAPKPAKTETRLSENKCNYEAFGNEMPVTSIAEPVSAVKIGSLVWKASSNGIPAHCYVSGVIEPIDKQAPVINFAVVLPSVWNIRAIHKGGGGMNGAIPNLVGKAGLLFGGGSDLSEGYVSYGSDSGHGRDNSWVLNDEAVKNFGYMQMKKTHDAAMVLIERAYSSRPEYNYYIGHSQGGREALTVAQRYPKDYDGVVAAAPVVQLSSLMLAPTLIRVQEKSINNWVPSVKGKAIAAEFMQQCDKLDGLVDGVINNYTECREIFNVGKKDIIKSPWSNKQCSDDIDPDPSNDTINACFTKKQIETLHFVFSSLEIDVKISNNVKEFGMWAPTTSVGNSFGGGFPGGLFVNSRYAGQEGAADNAPLFNTLGVEGVTGIIMGNAHANPLNYDDGSQYEKRFVEVSQWVDSTNPDLSEFKKRGGKLLVIIGSDDSIASTGAQLNYYQSVLDKMGEKALGAFARLWVIPQGDHGLRAMSYTLNGDLEEVKATPIPSSFDRLGLITDWVEKNQEPNQQIVLQGQTGSIPMCSYPEYPAYQGGDVKLAPSYKCSLP